MNIELLTRTTGPDIALFRFEDRAAPMGVAPALGKSLAKLGAEEGFAGKDKELVVLHPADGQPGGRVFLTGLGKRKSLTHEVLRQRVAALVKRAGEMKRPTLDVMVPTTKEIPFSVPAFVQVVVEAARLASYRYNGYKTSPGENDKGLETLNLVMTDKALLNARLRDIVSKTELVLAGVLYARDLINEPPSRKTPETIGALAEKLAVPDRIKVTVYHKPEIEEMGMGGLLSVAAGSNNPPIFLHLEYTPKQAKKTVAIVGKGITFDSGGLNIKTGTFMNNMKDDMSGAAAVLGIFHALGKIDWPHAVHGLIPLTENMSGGSAMKVGDVFKAYNGKTVEVLNTDAEGRLILADGLSYGAKLKPDLLIDLATLTGACVVALGPQMTGVLGTAAPQIRKLVAMGPETGEYFWELPLFEGYKEWLKSKVADINNIGKPGSAGTIFAGLFLKEFVDDVPWIHLDIAGTAFIENEKDYEGRKDYLKDGGTGVPIRSLFALMMTL